MGDLADKIREMWRAEESETPDDGLTLIAKKEPVGGVDPHEYAFAGRTRDGVCIIIRDGTGKELRRESPRRG